MGLLKENKNFFKLWLGQLVSILGDQIHFIALMVLIQNVFGNIVVTGTVMMVTALPKIIFSPFAGVFVDRWSLKKTMVVSDLIRMVLVGLIPILFYLIESPSMSIILILTFLISTVSVFFYPAKSASIPTLVEKDKLLEANSLSGTTQMMISLLGLLGGAVLVSMIGTTMAFILDASTFLISAIAISFINYPAKQKELSNSEEAAKSYENQEKSTYLTELKLGAKYVAKDQVLRFMLSFFTTIMLIAGALNVLFFAYIEDVLHQDASTIGYIMGANMIGMIIGMLTIPKVAGKVSKVKLLVWSTIIFAFTFSSFSWVNQLALAIPLMVVNGVGNGILNISSSTIFQEYIQENMRGRVFSVLDSIVNSAAMISMLPAAWLAQQYGVENIFRTAAIFILIVFVLSVRKAGVISVLLEEHNQVERLSKEENELQVANAGVNSI